MAAVNGVLYADYDQDFLFSVCMDHHNCIWNPGTGKQSNPREVFVFICRCLLRIVDIVSLAGVEVSVDFSKKREQCEVS